MYRKKTEHAVQAEEAKSVHLMRGILLEEPVLRWYALLSGRSVKQVGTIVHPKHPLVIATPDGVASLKGEPDVVVEVKCPSWRTAKEWGEDGTDEVPDHYVPQLMWEMAVTGLHSADVVAYMGDEPHIYRVHFNHELFDALLAIAEDFWKTHIVPQVPPEADASESYSEFLKDRFPLNRDTTLVQATPEIERWAQVLRDVEGQIKVLDAQADEAKNHLRAYIGEHDGLMCDLGKITWKAAKSKMVTDWQALAKTMNAPEDLIEKYTHAAKPVRTLNKPWSRAHKKKKESPAP